MEYLLCFLVRPHYKFLISVPFSIFLPDQIYSCNRNRWHPVVMETAQWLPKIMDSKLLAFRRERGNRKGWRQTERKWSTADWLRRHLNWPTGQRIREISAEALKFYLSTAASASKAHAGYKRLIRGQREEIYPAAQRLNSSHIIRSLGLLVVI